MLWWIFMNVYFNNLCVWYKVLDKDPVIYFSQQLNTRMYGQRLYVWLQASLSTQDDDFIKLFRIGASRLIQSTVDKLQFVWNWRGNSGAMILGGVERKWRSNFMWVELMKMTRGVGEMNFQIRHGPSPFNCTWITMDLYIFVFQI